MKKIFLIVVVIGFGNLAKARGITPEVLLVGNGVECTHTTIGSAIADQSPDGQIRVVNDHIYEENLTITKNLIIIGYYTSCVDALNNVSNEEEKTIIDAKNLGNAVNIKGDNIEFGMAGFTLENGLSTGVTGTDFGGAIDITGDNLVISLVLVDIENSVGVLGGGISMRATASVLNLAIASVSNNTATNGGGIYCSSNGIGNTLNIVNVGISGNHANGAFDFSGFGGGVYVKNCGVDFINYTNFIDYADSSVSYNTSTSSGGGIYALNSAIFTPDNGQIPLKIDHNTANTDLDEFGDGGGMYLKNSYLQTTYLHIDNNTIVNGYGGGLYLDSSTILSNTKSSGYNTCYEEGNMTCNLFSNNSAIASQDSPLAFFTSLGGAIYMANGSGMSGDLDSLRARFINNSADSGSAIGLFESSLDVQGSYFINNGNQGVGETQDKSVFTVGGDDPILDLSFSTMANNLSSHVFKGAPGGTINLFGSIVYESNDANHVISIGNSAFNVNCSIFHEAIGPVIGPARSNVLGIGSYFITDDPGFISEETGNYHLRPDSIAIDRCEAGLGDNNITKDSDLDIRGLDFPGISNSVVGDYDAGADEALVDLIFADGFEE